MLPSNEFFFFQYLSNSLSLNVFLLILLMLINILDIKGKENNRYIMSALLLLSEYYSPGIL